MSDLLAIARWYVDHGVSVIPVKADGSKAPAITGWRKYSAERPDDATLEKWFGPTAGLVGVGVPCGPASGNLVVLDFECHGESAYFEWLQRLPEHLQEVAERLPTVITPSGGRHVWVRLSDPQGGGKLARYADGKTKIEVRGEGHQVLAPGCPAECHRTGRLYEWASPPGNDNGSGEPADPFPTLPGCTWAELCEHSAACNEHLPPEQPRDRDTRTGTPAGVNSPGNDFNARGSWAETGLFDAGWRWEREAGDDRGFLTRPGKGTGISASVGMVSSKETGYPFLYVWTTSTDFPTETPISRFAVYAQLKHNGDFSAAAKELARQGYGERLEMRGRERTETPEPATGAGTDQPDLSAFSMKLNTPDGQPFHPFVKPPAPPAADGSRPGRPRPFKWMSELQAVSEEAKWVWQGYLARGGITLFSALWKSGKSTLLSHLLRAVDGRQSEFLGLPVAAGRVLYVTEEHERLWAERRDKLMIGDHVGMACQPFKLRPTMGEWRDYLRTLAGLVEEFGFDLVVFDTLSKMWPCRDENDAGQVEEALMPLWELAAKEVAVLLVHHTRKSGGAEFVGARGSGGLPAFCEILIEFGRASDDPRETKRVLKAAGRYHETPVKLLADLTPAGYVSLGDPDDRQVVAATKVHDWTDDLNAVLGEFGSNWATFDEVSERLTARRGESIRKVNLLGEINRRFDSGEMEREGEGRRGSPYRYRLPVIETATPETVSTTAATGA